MISARRYVLPLVAAVVTATITGCDGSAGQQGAARPSVPNPGTAEMQAPVAEVIADARAAVLRAPGSAAAWGRFGMVLDAHHMYGDAATCYRRAHELDPAEFRWAYFLPIVMDHDGADAETIVEHLRVASELQPGHAPLYARLGEVLARSGRVEGARVAYEKALEIAPRYPIAHRGLGQVALGMGDAAGAVRHLEQAVRLQDGDRGTYAALAQAYRQLGMQDQARRAAAASRSLGKLYSYLDHVRAEVGSLGVSTTIVLDRARYRMSTGQFEQALEDLKLAERATPDDEWVQRQLARAYRELGDEERAAIHLAKAERLRDQQ